ncbi:MULTISPECIES: hypothetical protein [unclassified Streptomyces]|uniref:hypothetical protein n=1 Tax=unclassified Streptomyces TaxID=2593676 RepID=UPI002E2F9801|nr:MULTISPECIES: hypothetical protein [unclassified Streptomyces]WUC69234.1 hypothetical protein OG861_33915 [Streptomyces sp. NBC_00539]
MTATLTPRAGKIDDIRREDDSRGYERDETDSFHQVGTMLRTMAERDDARIPKGRRARRTLAEMAPGYVRPPLLSFNVPFRAADDACVLCGFWTCRCGQNAAAPAPSASATGTVR